MQIRTTTHILGIAALDVVLTVGMVVAMVMVVRHENETHTRGYPLKPVPTLTRNTQVNRVRVRVQELPQKKLASKTVSLNLIEIPFTATVVFCSSEFCI